MSEQESRKFHQFDGTDCEKPTADHKFLTIKWPKQVQVTEVQMIKQVLELDIKVANNAVLKLDQTIDLLCTAVNVSYAELTWHRGTDPLKGKSFLTERGWTIALTISDPDTYTCKSKDGKETNSKNIQWAHICDSADLAAFDNGRVNDDSEIKVNLQNILHFSSSEYSNRLLC